MPISNDQAQINNIRTLATYVMEKLYESEFVSHFIVKEESLLKSTWKGDTATMNADQFTAECKEQIHLFAANNASKLYSDSRNFNYPISPEQQAWLDNELLPQLITAGIAKWALIYPEEFIAQLSVNQLLEEENSQSVNIRFFSSETEAIEWLHQ
ncbi:hypothetical protein [Microscilla marina]|uniref:STAS/SEC14 domain-containing protein n=1 Tax=Microscilla marina ATCC 23134 TaxID=313606 RepID=A1ZQ44_MICM2|nr:hypothetical protein [Microscilla marina]EAY27453.1 hypothetical protein M23134_06854 [Microscilla marina ATCC 23134]